MTQQMNVERLESEYSRIMAIAANMTKGRWGWFGSATGEHLYLATIERGREYVMDFVRWGMRAQPRFQPNGGFMVPATDLFTFEVGKNGAVGIEAAKKDASVYRYDIDGIECADAKLMAEIPCMIELLGLLHKKNQQLRQQLTALIDQNLELRSEVRASAKDYDELVQASQHKLIADNECKHEYLPNKDPALCMKCQQVWRQF